MMQESLRFVTFYDLDLMDLKALGRFRQKTIKQQTRLLYGVRPQCSLCSHYIYRNKFTCLYNI